MQRTESNQLQKFAHCWKMSSARRLSKSLEKLIMGEIQRRYLIEMYGLQNPFKKCPLVETDGGLLSFADP